MLFKCSDTPWEEAVEVTAGFSHDGLVLCGKGAFVVRRWLSAVRFVVTLHDFSFTPVSCGSFMQGSSESITHLGSRAYNTVEQKESYNKQLEKM